jgi:serine/threonine protein kinase
VISGWQGRCLTAATSRALGVRIVFHSRNYRALLLIAGGQEGADAAHPPRLICTLYSLFMPPSPELLLKQPFGTESDLWAAGILLYHSLAGYTPFAPVRSCLESVVSFHMGQRVWQSASDTDGNSTLSASGPWAGPLAVDLIKRLLEPAPENRIAAKEAICHSWYSTSPFVQFLFP